MSSYASLASSINITLSEPLKTYVDARTEAGNFGIPAQYIRELITEDFERRKRRLERHLVDALKDEANAIEVPDNVWESGDIVGFLTSVRKWCGSAPPSSAAVR